MIPIFSRVARRRLLHSAVLPIALPLLLAGCAALAPPATPTAPPAAAQQARPYHDAIELGGRLSVRYQQNGREEAVHGSFTWAQTPERTNVVLLSPLGQTIAAIDVTPVTATLSQANQPPRTADDVDALAQQALGWPLPVAGLRNWLQGFVTGADGRRQAVPAADDSSLASDGWRIRYASWQDAGSGAAAHPKRIDLERDTASAGTVALRIVIDNWQTR